MVYPFKNIVPVLLVFDIGRMREKPVSHVKADGIEAVALGNEIVPRMQTGEEIKHRAQQRAAQTESLVRGT